MSLQTPQLPRKIFIRRKIENAVCIYIITLNTKFLLLHLPLFVECIIFIKKEYMEIHYITISKLDVLSLKLNIILQNKMNAGYIINTE